MGGEQYLLDVGWISEMNLKRSRFKKSGREMMDGGSALKRKLGERPRHVHVYMHNTSRTQSH